MLLKIQTAAVWTFVIDKHLSIHCMKQLCKVQLRTFTPFLPFAKFDLNETEGVYDLLLIAEML